MNDLMSFLQGASNSAASTVSAPVDGIAWLLRKAGLPVNNPIGGSDWMAQRGLTQEPQNKLAGLLGEAAGGVAPMVAGAYAPKIAGGLLQMADNAAAPATLNKQAGVVKLADAPEIREKLARDNNRKRMDELIVLLSENGIKPAPRFGTDAPYSLTQNGIGGQSSYMEVPGFGTVRFSDHHANFSNTFRTPQEALEAIMRQRTAAEQAKNDAKAIRQSLGLVNSSGKENLQIIKDWLSRNPQSGQAKDPGYWANKARLDTSKTGGWSFSD